MKQLQLNLIISHSAGTGKPISLEYTRMLLALRINILCKGHSGISIENLEKYVEAFNKDILPLVPEQGTVGASGDLAPLSHLAAGLLGYGKIYNFETNQYECAEKMLKKMNFAPIVLNEKEGLALINGT